MTLVIPEELLKKLRGLKEVSADGHGNTMVDVIDKAVTVALKKYDPLMKKATSPGEIQKHQRRPYLSVSKRRELHERHASSCTFVSPIIARPTKDSAPMKNLENEK